MTDDRSPASSLPRDTGTDTLAGAVLRWIPAIIMAYALIVSPLLMQWGGAGGSADINVAAAQSNRLNQAFWIAVFLAALLSARHNFRHLPRLLGDPVALLLLVYLAFAGLSVLWSPVPAIAFRRVVLQAIIVLALGMSIVLADDRDALLDRLLAVIAVTVLINAAVVLTTPPGPIGHEGIYSQKNGLGAAMAFSFVFCLYGAAVKQAGMRAAFIALALAALYALVMSRSKTSLGLALLIPAIVFATIAITRAARMNAALFLLFCTALALAGWFYISAMTRFGFAELSMMLFGDETFTGRTVIWNFVLDVIARAPVLGQGYASFWGIGADSIVEREAPGFVAGLLQAHNGYLDLLLETGIVGLSLLVAVILAALFAAARTARNLPALCWLSMTLVVTVACHNMLESSWFRGYSLIWMLFIVAALLPRAPGR